jgi:prepilin-type N-terminal cleavage/methylation domain-containing protein
VLQTFKSLNSKFNQLKPISWDFVLYKNCRRNNPKKEQNMNNFTLKARRLNPLSVILIFTKRSDEKTRNGNRFTVILNLIQNLMQNKKIKRKAAFTLAEVMITILVVAVIAALTIPGLMTQYKRIVLDKQFRKAYSQLTQAVKLWQEEETEDIWGNYYNANTTEKANELQGAFYKYLKGSYLPKDISSAKYPYYTSAKNSTTIIHYCPASCCGNPVNSNAFLTFDNVMYYVCAGDNVVNFAIDINGYNKGPNKWGIDYFDFEIGSDNILYAPEEGYYGCKAYDRHQHDTGGNDGMACSYYALRDKDYFKKIDL